MISTAIMSTYKFLKYFFINNYVWDCRIAGNRLRIRIRNYVLKISHRGPDASEPFLIQIKIPILAQKALALLIWTLEATNTHGI